MRIAEAAIAAARQEYTVSDLGEIGDQCLVVFLEDLAPAGTLSTISCPLPPPVRAPFHGRQLGLKCCR